MQKLNVFVLNLCSNNRWYYIIYKNSETKKNYFIILKKHTCAHLYEGNFHTTLFYKITVTFNYKQSWNVKSLNFFNFIIILGWWTLIIDDMIQEAVLCNEIDFLIWI